MQCDLQKNFVKRIKNLSQHLSEKFIGDNISITDIAIKIQIYRSSVSPRAFLKLSLIVIALVQKGLSCPSLPVQDALITSGPVTIHLLHKVYFCIATELGQVYFLLTPGR